MKFKTNKYYKGINADDSKLIFKVLRQDKKIGSIKIKVIKDDDSNSNGYHVGLKMTLYINCNAVGVGTYFTNAKEINSAEILALVL